MLCCQLSAERIYWDQATVLAQLGLLERGALPVSGADQADKVLAMAEGRHDSGPPSNCYIAAAEKRAA